MNWFDQIVSSQIVYRLGWTVIHSLWQGIAIAIILATALILIPKRKNNLRYSCSCLALIAIFAAFCTTAYMIPPKSIQPTDNPWIAKPTPPANTQTITPVTLTTTLSNPTDTSPHEPIPTAKTTKTSAPSKSWQTQIAKTISPLTGYITFAWLVGVLAMSLWNLGGFIAVRRLRLIGTWPVTDQLTETLKHLTEKFAIKRTVKILQSTVIKTPITIGWLKPIILIPTSILSELSTEQIQAIIAHELAHIRRFDYLVNLLQTLAETILFHHPAVWWISNKIRTEREYCCDNAVIKLTSDQLNYAKALTSIAQMRNTAPQLAVAASGGSLLSRIRRILGTDSESSLLRNPSAGWAFIALIIVIAAFAVGIGINNDNILAIPHKYGQTKDNGEYETLQKMIGTWTVNTKESTATGNVQRIEIKPDATCIRYESKNNNPKTFYDKIQLKKDKLTISGYWGKQAFNLNLEENKMTWSQDNTKFTFDRLQKLTAVKQIPGITTSNLIGDWQMVGFVGENKDNIKSMDLMFLPNGSWNSTAKGPEGSDYHDDDKGKYKIQNGKLIFEDHPDIEFSFDGKRLTIKEDKTKIFFEKKPTVTTNPKAIIGKWKCTDVSDMETRGLESFILEFNSDNSGRSAEIGFGGIEETSDHFIYKVEGNTISAKGPDTDDDWEPLLWRIEDDVLYLTEDKDHTYKYSRLDTPAKAQSKPAAYDIESLLGTWQAGTISGDNPDNLASITLTFNADGTYYAQGQDTDGEQKVSGGTYKFDNGRIIPNDAGPDTIIRLEGSNLIVTDNGTKVVYQKKPDTTASSTDVDITPYVGSWLVPDKAVMTIEPSGVVTMHHFDGNPKTGAIVRHDNGKYILDDGNSECYITVTGDLLSCTQIDNKAHPDTPHQYFLARITIDEQFIGSWSATDVPDDPFHITAIFLDLKDDSTFILQSEGQGSSGKPVRGIYTADGNTIQLFGGQNDLLGTASARYHDGTIRMGLQQVVAVLKRNIPNPFEGSEHPMFRAMLTSARSQNGQIWLDLDTGKSVGKDQWELMTKTDKSMYELTLHKALSMILTLSSESARLLPIRHGSDFARNGVEAVKHLPSLKKSNLRTTGYKHGTFLAVLTDRGRLAVVEILTPTAAIQTPLGWSLADIIEEENGKTKIKIIKTDKPQKHILMPKTYRVTIPDLDKLPHFLDLAICVMISISKDNSEKQISELDRGDLGFESDDNQIVTIRGGSIYLWDGAKAEAIESKYDEYDNTRAYQLPKVPCRLLAVTAEKKQFDIKVLTKTKDGGLDIEYWQLETPVPLPDIAAMAPIDYTVQPGDTLADISKKHYGTTDRYEDILKLNKV